MQHQPHEHREDQPPGERERVVRDLDSGREWRVRLADCRDVPGSRSPYCLIFDCGTMVRRVWSPSVAWQLLTDAELLALVERDPPR